MFLQRNNRKVRFIEQHCFVKHVHCERATTLFISMLLHFIFQQQIAAILKTPDSSFTINYVDVQRQNGGSDCGLFAVMFAAALCNGKDPHTISVDQQGMRQHLHKCFEEGEISEFPAASEPRRIGRHRVAYTTNIPVVCFCRLFWHKADTARGPLIQCTLCKEWFHQECAKLDNHVLNSQSHTSGNVVKLFV